VTSIAEQLVQTRSEDGYLLEGLVIRPEKTVLRGVVVWIHGLYAAMYAPPGIDVGRELARHGFAVVLGNNRGHNVGAWLRRDDGTTLLAGGAWERLGELGFDVGAWVTLGAELGQPVILAGHSLGATKAVAYLAERSDDRVSGLLLLSPRMGRSTSDPELLSLARALVEDGRGSHLLPVPASYALSAATFLDHSEGPAADAFKSDWLAKLTVPVAAICDDEAGADFGALYAEIGQSTQLTWETVTGGGHLFAGFERQVAALAARWIDGLRSP
jgi:alpha-beta hydrolase superfamily lysophospholipase